MLSLAYLILFALYKSPCHSTSTEKRVYAGGLGENVGYRLGFSFSNCREPHCDGSAMNMTYKLDGRTDIIGWWKGESGTPDSRKKIHINVKSVEKASPDKNYEISFTKRIGHDPKEEVMITCAEEVSDAWWGCRTAHGSFKNHYAFSAVQTDNIMQLSLETGGFLNREHYLLWRQSVLISDLTFAAKMTKELFKTGANYVFSPYSLKQALGMLEEGMLHDTRRQLIEFGDLTFYGQKRIVDSNLVCANNFYWNSGWSFRPTLEYQERISKKYGADTVLVDFANSQEACDTINNSVNATTGGKIRRIVGTESFDENTAGVIVNALFFKASWLQKFSVLGEMDFYSKGEVKQVTYLQLESTRIGYYRTSDVLAVSIPYENNHDRMVLIMPSESQYGQFLSQEVNGMNEIMMKSLEPNYRMVRVKIPKFSYESVFDMLPLFRNMGLNWQVVEVPDMGRMTGSGMPFRLRKIQHAARIEVNKDGTVAGAATAINVSYRTAHMNVAVFDSPFFFYIVNCQSGKIILHGYYS